MRANLLWQSWCCGHCSRAQPRCRGAHRLHHRHQGGRRQGGKGGWCPAGSLSPVGTGSHRGSPGEDAASRGHHPPSQPQGGSEASKACGQRGWDSCSELPQLVGGAEDRPSAHGLAPAGAWSLCSLGSVTSNPAPQSRSCGELHFQGARGPLSSGELQLGQQEDRVSPTSCPHPCPGLRVQTPALSTHGSVSPLPALPPHSYKRADETANTSAT